MSRENRKIAISWAKQVVTPKNVIISDQFWTCVENYAQAQAIAEKLAKSNILAFQGPTKTGVVLVHKSNPHLKVEAHGLMTDDPKLNGTTVHTGIMVKDEDIALLAPWHLNFREPA